jgi:hypothetical protein
MPFQKQFIEANARFRIASGIASYGKTLSQASRLSIESKTKGHPIKVACFSPGGKRLITVRPNDSIPTILRKLKN